MFVHLHHLLVVPDLFIRRLGLVLLTVGAFVAIAFGVHTRCSQSLFDPLAECGIDIAHVLVVHFHIALFLFFTFVFIFV